MNKVVLALVVLVIAGAAVFLLSSRDPGGVDPNTPPAIIAEGIEPVAKSLAPAEGEREAAPAGETPAPPVAVPAGDDAEPAPGKGVILGTVTYASDGVPAADVGVACDGGYAPLDAAMGARTRSDAAGRFAFRDLEPGSYRVVADRGGDVRVQVEPDSVRRVHVRIPAGATVAGIVRDPQGGPVAAADVWLSQRNVQDAGTVATRTDAAGRFALRDVASECWIGARAAGYRDSALRYLKHAAGEARQIEILLTRGDARVRGRVLGTSGPAASVAVEARAAAKAEWTATADGAPQLSSAPRSTRTGADGTFELSGLPPGEILVRARAVSSSVAEARVSVAAGGVGDVSLTLPPSARLWGTITENGARPRARVRLYVHHEERSFGTQWIEVGDDGRYGADVAAGQIPVQVWSPDGIVLRETLQLAPGESRQWNPDVGARGYVRGRLRDSLGRALSGYSVAAFRDGKWAAEVVTDAEGAFAFEQLGEGPVLLRVGIRPDGAGEHTRITALAREVTPPQDALDLVIDASGLPDASARGRVLAPNGVPLAGAVVQFGADGGAGLADVRTGEDGTFQLRRLVPCPYWVTVRHGDHPLLHLGRHELAAGQERDFGDVMLTAGGTVVVAVDGADGADVSAVRIAILDAKGAQVATCAGAGGVRTSGPVPAGTLDLVISGQGIASARHPVTVASGQETRVQVSVRRGLRHVVLATQPAGAAVPRWVAASLYGAERQHIGGFGLARGDDGVWRAEMFLAPGSYTLMVGSDGSRLFGRAEFTAGGDGTEIAVSLAPR